MTLALACIFPVASLSAPGAGGGEIVRSPSAAGSGTGARERSVALAVPQPTATLVAAAGLDALPVSPPATASTSARCRSRCPPASRTRSSQISDLHSAVLNGTVDGTPFRVETTLLSQTRSVEWSESQCVETLVSQYVAYLGGRIEEVALDLYAQADDGSVWYFEEMFNYRNRVIADTDGTWLAGKEGPAAMIMPGQPQVGDVHRPENVPGLVFEEVVIKTTGQPVDGLRGRVDGAIVGRELHDDGIFSEKFAPGTASSSAVTAATTRRSRWPFRPKFSRVPSRPRSRRWLAGARRVPPSRGRGVEERCGRGGGDDCRLASVIGS